jgi:hypothetical protein
MTRRTEPASPGEGAFRSDLVHPLPALAVLVLALNDHLLKGSGWLPGWLTGKLSDFAGLFFFPVLLTVVAEAALRRSGRAAGRRVVAAGSVVATGVVFALLKSVPDLAGAVGRYVGTIVADRSDLLALAMLAPSYRYLARHVPARPAPRWAQGLGVLLAGVASMATEQPPERGFALWGPDGAGSRAVGCATVEAWVSKSAKTGLGLTLGARARGREPACTVAVEDATLYLSSGQEVRPGAALPRELTIGDGSQAEGGGSIYLPFAFDNNHAWNTGVRSATLRVTLRGQGEARVTWDVPLAQRYEGYMVRRPPHGAAP